MRAILLAAILGHGDGTFQTTNIIPLPSPAPVCVAAGDFNHDGKVDLAAVNGGRLLQVRLQEERRVWQSSQLPVGQTNFFLRSADLDGDGADDLVVASLNAGAFVALSRGDGSFKPAQLLPRTTLLARWAAVGDWDGDGLLDLAVALNQLVCILGQGVDGSFSFLRSYRIDIEWKPHGVEAADYDGDGRLDLLAAIGDHGVRPLQGHGDGTFTFRPDVKNLGCGHTIAVGDFNGDGKADLATVCDAFADAVEVGLSAGNGAFRKTYEGLEGIGFRQCLAIADLDGDQALDLAVGADAQAAVFAVPGRGDGTFAPQLRIEPTGGAPSFLAARDLDGDGRTDLVSADTASSTLSVFWGQGGARFLQAGIRLVGFSGARDLAVGDLDGDGTPDILLPGSQIAAVQVYLGPIAARARPDRRIAVSGPYDSLEAADLDGDGVLDLAGTKVDKASALVAFLGPRREAERELVLPVGDLPGSLSIGRIDAGDRLDLAVLSSYESAISIFTGREGREFSGGRLVPTVETPRALTLGDFDGDGRTDLAAAAPGEVAFHFQDERGGFSDGPRLPPPGGKVRELTAVDLDRDGLADALVSESSGSTVHLFRSRGKTFETSVAGTLDGLVVSLVAGDLDGDGLPDITASTVRSVSVILNRGPQGFARPVIYKAGIVPAGHRLADLDQDGALDLVVFNATGAVVLLGRSAPATPGFLRGDANGDRSVDLSDAVAIVNGLFLGGTLPCPDAADANDDGAVELADPVAVLEALFLGGNGGRPLPPPGTGACGADPTPDGLPECGWTC